MKILVTGGAGYIGSHTCKYLASAGHVPVVFDDLSQGHDWAVQWGPFERGSLTRLDGSPDAADQLRGVVDEHVGGRRVGQLGLGTNTGVIAPIGALLQDLKLPGAHLVLGHTCPEVTGARFDSDIEVPLLVRRASVSVDGVPVLTNGRYPRELLA